MSKTKVVIVYVTEEQGKGKGVKVTPAKGKAGGLSKRDIEALIAQTENMSVWPRADATLIDKLTKAMSIAKPKMTKVVGKDGKATYVPKIEDGTPAHHKFIGNTLTEGPVEFAKRLSAGESRTRNGASAKLLDGGYTIAQTRHLAQLLCSYCPELGMSEDTGVLPESSSSLEHPVFQAFADRAWATHEDAPAVKQDVKA